MGKIIWTRPTSDWPKDRLVLGEHDYIVPIPATMQRPVESTTKILDDALCIFSSTKAVEYMATHRPDLIQSLKDSDKIVCFGAKTAKSLNALGLRVSQDSTSKSLEELCRVIAEKHADTPVVYIGAKDSAFDIDSFFAKQNLNFLHLSLYETLPVDIHQSLIQWIDKKEPLLICVASPSATRSVLASLPEKNRKNLAIEFLCIGQTTAQALLDSEFRFSYVDEPSMEGMAKNAMEWYNKLLQRGT